MTNHDRHKAIGRRDVVLFCVSAILLLDTVATSAAIGVSSLFWWLLLGVVFFIPLALISAELGCTYPDQGGIYAWVRRAHGPRWGARITWAYWVNVAVWIPSLVTLFAGIGNQMFDAGLPFEVQIAIGLVVIWLMVFVNCVALDVGKWVPNLGAIIKIIVFLAIIVGGFSYYQQNGTANPITLEALQPNLGDGLQYLPVIIYGMLGFELICAGADDIREPEKNVPFGVLTSGFIIIVCYVLATFAVLAAIPAEDIDLVEGLLDTLARFFGGSAVGDAFVFLLGVGTIYTFFSNGVTWALGSNRAAAQAAQEGELPAIFGRESATRKTPVGAAIMLGVASSIILVLYGFLAGTSEDLFWSLFAFSGVIFLIPYVAMMTAFITLRRQDTDTTRPFSIGGPKGLAEALAYFCAFILCLTIGLFNYVPGDGMQWEVFIGSAGLLVLGEILIRSVEGAKKDDGHG